ncbi:MAG: copper homeostasis protein CutC [Bacteroidota bacterium]|jgi:copper homeostasis protein|nr:MAG: copper homeostasis protein CutC [Bacteroidota bacterium]
MIVEVVVYNIASALNAQTGGADRIELCDNPGEGGTTPSAGTIEVVRKNLSIDVYVMIRPRGGDFLYSRYEFHAMKRDIAMAQRLSADGVVLGILKPDGTLDVDRCGELIAFARPMKVTCHRAFDMTRDPFETLEACIDAGFDRILTSGGHATAAEGVSKIAELVRQAQGRITIMPGSGINEQTVAAVVRGTGAKEIHFSAVGSQESGMIYRNERIAGMGDDRGREFMLRTVDPDRVREIRRIATEAAR